MKKLGNVFQSIIGSITAVVIVVICAAVFGLVGLVAAIF